MGALMALACRLAAADASRIALTDSLHEEEARSSSLATAKSRPQAIVVRPGLLPEEAAAEMKFSVALRMRNFEELQARLAAGELIAPAEMAEKYWPLAADEAQVADWLKSEGFTLARRDDNHLAVFASGTVSRVQAVFQTAFARVALEGVEYTSALTVPSMPATPGRAVLGVNGLQPHIHPRHHGHIRPLGAGNAPPYLPAQIIKAYHAENVGWTGAGQTIAIVIDTPPKSTDLTAFWNAAGIAQSLTNIQTVQVIPGTLPAPDGEESLDVEWSSAMAPAAKVRVYATWDLFDANLDQAYQQIYQDAKTIPGLRQVSLSYGLGESETSRAQLLTDAQYFANLASLGITVFASSGDDGARPDDSLQVESPASDVNVTAVGGTSLLLDAAGVVSSENGWDGSGGGLSRSFSRPVWQKGPGITTETKRLVPDVALVADVDTGAVVYLNGVRHTYGGTSWSSPTWAGFCALINQALARGGLPPLGVLGAKAYPLLGTASFRDITGGGNDAYGAGPGYDRCTGLGVPDVAALILALTGGPEITVQPADQTAGAGQSVTFSVTAKAGSALTYQWQREPVDGTVWSDLANGGSFGGARAALLTVGNPVVTMNGDRFRCLVSNSSGSQLTRTATLTIRTAELAQTGVDPGAQSLGFDEPLQGTLVVANRGALSTVATKVFLYFSTSAVDFDTGSKIGELALPALAAGASTGNLPFSYLPPAGTVPGTYFLNYWIDAPGLVTEGNENDNRGSRTFLIHAVGPRLVTQPANQTVVAGGEAKFAVAVQGTPPFSYRWSRKPAGSPTWKSLGDDSNYSGTALPTLTVSRSTPAMNGDQFECVVTNSAASVTSDPATLIVGAPDLTVLSGRVVPNLGIPGTGFTRTIVVTNSGNAASIPTKVDFFLNPTPSQFSGGTKVGSAALPALAVGTAASVEFTYQSPANASLGVYSFYYVIDGDNLVAERNEANNTFGANITLNRIETRSQPVTKGIFQLLFRYADGSTPTLNGWSVQWRSDPPQGTDTNWNTLTAPLYLTNGFVGVSDTNVTHQPRRYFRVTGQ